MRQGEQLRQDLQPDAEIQLPANAQDDPVAAPDHVGGDLTQRCEAILHPDIQHAVESPHVGGIGGIRRLIQQFGAAQPLRHPLLAGVVHRHRGRGRPAHRHERTLAQVRHVVLVPLPETADHVLGQGPNGRDVHRVQRGNRPFLRQFEVLAGVLRPVRGSPLAAPAADRGEQPALGSRGGHHIWPLLGGLVDLRGQLWLSLWLGLFPRRVRGSILARTAEALIGCPAAIGSTRRRPSGPRRTVCVAVVVGGSVREGRNGRNRPPSRRSTAGLPLGVRVLQQPHRHNEQN